MHKILLAEDDNDMRRFLVKALENAGFEVSPHDNGMSAYQRLREEPFEMLLTDIVMPEMDGIELARRASELDPDIKIMFITGFAAVALNPGVIDTDMLRSCWADGAASYPKAEQWAKTAAPAILAFGPKDNGSSATITGFEE